MKEEWNARAQKNAFHYVETHFDGDIDYFFEKGGERFQSLVVPVLNKLSLNLPESAAVDLGCGLGRFTRFLSGQFSRVYGVDVSERMVESARSLHKGEKYENIEFVVSDGLQIPIDDHSVDFLWSYEVFQHMPDNKIIECNVREVARVLRPKGYALLHFRTALGSSLKSIYFNVIPANIDRVIRTVFGKDPMKAGPSFRGAVPMNCAQIEEMCDTFGLETIEFRDDPTHKAGTRIFAMVQSTSIQG